MAKRNNKPKAEDQKLEGDVDPQVDENNAPEDDQVDPEVESKQKTEPKPGPARHNMTKAQKLKLVDVRVRSHIRDVVSRDCKSGLFVRQLCRKFGISEDEAQAAIKGYTDQIDKLLKVDELKKG